MNVTHTSTDRPGARGPDPRRRRRRLRGVLAGIAALALVAVAASPASAAPWVCDGTGYITRFDVDAPPAGTGGDTLFQRAVRQPNGSYAFASLGSFSAEHVNALAFRPQDGFMYAFNNTAKRVVRIESDAVGNMAPTTLPPTAGLPSNFNTVIGTVLTDGRYFMYGTAGPTNDPTGVIVDVTANTAVTLAPGPGFVIGSDIAVSPVDGKIYSANPSGVFEILISGGTLTNGPRVADGNTSGAQWFLPDGRLVQYNNAASEMFVSDFDTGRSTLLGGAPAASNVDGASCANSVALTKDASPRTVTAGAELTYTYAIEAHGLVDNPVDFIDTLPAGMTYVPGGVTVNGAFGAPNAYGGTDTLSIAGTIARNTTVTISARVRVSPDHACNVDVDNQAEATMHAAGLPDVIIDSDDPTTPANPEDPTTVHVNCAADVSIVKSAMQSPIVPGQDAGFTFVATNNGPSTAKNVTVTDPLPAQFRFASASAGCNEAGGRLTCTVAELAAGASQTFTVTGRVASSLDQCLANTATVTSATPDPNAANNRSDICVPIKPEASLVITKTPSRTELPAGGGQVMYTLVVENLGPSDDPGVEVRDALAPGLRLVSARPSQGSCSTAGGRVDCDLGALRAGGSAQVLVTVDVHGTPGCIANVATVDGTRGASREASATVCVPPGPPPPAAPPFDLRVDKTANVRRPVIGQRVTYRIVVRNNGPAAAPDVELMDTLNRPARVVSVRASAGTCDRALPLDCRLGTIQPGARVTITVVVKPREAGCRQRNAASAVGSGTDANPANNMDVVARCVTKIPLRLTKVSNHRSVRAGQTFGYALRVTNPTRGVARNVRVCDRLPAGLVYVGSRPRARLSKGRRCWTIGRLGPKASRTFHVTVRALPGAGGKLVNRATARSRDARATARARRTVQVIAGQVAGGGVTG